jgi:YesN/AraC family two-component response regulator
VQEKKIDLVISDVMMPGIDGIELCKKIKSDKAYAHIPVIIITAKVTLEDKRIGLEAGVDDYIEKPFSIELLRLKMQQLIAIKEKMLQKGIPLTATEITSMDEKLIQRSIAFIEQHIDKQDLSVEALAQEVGMSRTNYYKRVLAVTGKTPSELIRSVRLQHASMLISKGQLRVSEVALMVGYNDIRLFRKYFHEEFGVYPSAMKPEKEIYKPKK